MTLSAKTLDSRKEPRFNVSWRARLQLAGGQEVEVRVRDISESGLGVVCDHPVTQGSVLNMTVGVPDLAETGRTLALQGRMRVMFAVMKGHDFLIGGHWAELSPAAQQLWRGWVMRLRTGGS
ncbi:PilZ domain-containing protein [Sphaerotilus hippei]|uniref:PilZ domain-containing protein n=1 Tax=Sphaerotilus hippei TaxID=744406 RepID=A0A318HBX2_9BURK|nr:PilZ domain-containing protein [Sphaerotilus hippei]PXW96601.1 PilZ domain-containing protein [Sphaerotilus hippei]